MKRKTTALLVVFALVLSLTGCDIVEFLNTPLDTPLFPEKEETKQEDLQTEEEDIVIITEQEKTDPGQIPELLKENKEIDAFGLFAGDWICEDGSYCQVFTRAEDGEKGIAYYDNEIGLYCEGYFLDVSLTDKNNNLYALSYPIGSNYEIYSVKLSEDGQSFENIGDGKTFERVDETLWSGINIMYIYPIQSLYADSSVWKGKELHNGSEESLDKCLYSVTDLDWDGYPEIIKSGYFKNDEHVYSYIYEYTPGDIPKMMDCEVLHNPDINDIAPSFYGNIIMDYTVDESGTWSEYRYITFGETPFGREERLLHEYSMNIKKNTVSLEVLCSKKTIKDNDGNNSYYYYDADNTEIKVGEFYGIMDEKSKNEKYVSINSFDKITLENMIESLRGFPFEYNF